MLRFRYKVFDDPRWDEGVTLTELMLWCGENDIPTSAKIQYAGCGTHEIEFVWEARPHEIEEILSDETQARVEAEALAQRQREEGLIA